MSCVIPYLIVKIYDCAVPIAMLGDRKKKNVHTIWFNYSR